MIVGRLIYSAFIVGAYRLLAGLVWRLWVSGGRVEYDFQVQAMHQFSSPLTSIKLQESPP
jgi:hypothetical protein